MDDEHVRVGFFVLFDQVRLGRVVAEAARVDAQHVDGGLALDDPFGKLPAGAARRSDAEGMALAQPEVVEIPGRTDDRVAVGRVGDGAVVHFLDADLGERRHAIHRRLDVRHQPVDILLEQLVLGARVGAVHVAAGRTFFVRAEYESAILFAQVPGAV